MSDVSQFGLLKTRRLLPLFVTQFLGAFNDNVFKQALMILLSFGALLSAAHDSNVIINLAAALFILPFFLFSPTAGALADHFEKSRLIQFVKLAEIAIAVLITFALISKNVPALLLVLFLLGMQSTFFGPLKFGILPQHLAQTELTGGNGVIEMGTFVAILIGTLLGNLIASMPGVDVWLPAIVISVAIAGYVASRNIPEAPSKNLDPPNWNPFTELLNLSSIVTERKAVFQAVLGISWFWLVGSVYLVQIPNLTVEHLNGTPSVVALILVVFTVAVALGSLTCERLSGRKIEIGLVPVGALGISVFGILAYFAIQSVDNSVQRDWQAFLFADGAPVLLAYLGGMGVFAGMFVVPLQAMIQARTPTEKRARVIAANNILNSLLMVLGAGIAILWLGYLKLDIPSLLLFIALTNLLVAMYIFYNVPEFAMRFLVWALGHSAYRVRHQGLENIPERGAAIIVCNHVSYVDAVLLAGAVRRPIRFIMDKTIYEIPVLNFIFRVGSAIPIKPRETDPDTYDSAFEQVRRGLENGDLLCIFPEGRLSSDGSIAEFRHGIDKILVETPVPVIPVALGGLWGSFFSRFEGARKDRPRRFFSPVHLTIDTPIEPTLASAHELRDRVMALRGAYQ